MHHRNDHLSTISAANSATRLLAFDYGLRRIGVASGSTVTATASPLTTLAAREGQPDWKALDSLLQEWGPDLIVLGLPYNSDGSESTMTLRVREFAAELQSRYDLPVATVDERFTSAEAESMLKNQRQQGLKTRRIKKADVDSLAATLIAESWLRLYANGSWPTSR